MWLTLFILLGNLLIGRVTAGARQAAYSPALHMLGNHRILARSPHPGFDVVDVTIKPSLLARWIIVLTNCFLPLFQPRSDQQQSAADCTPQKDCTPSPNHEQSSYPSSPSSSFQCFTSGALSGAELGRIIRYFIKLLLHIPWCKQIRAFHLART